jgi:hypothetical protein
MTFFELVFGFESFTWASFDLESKIKTMCIWSCQCTHQGGDWETKWFVPWIICVMINWLGLVWIWIRWSSVELTPNCVIRFGETQLLVSWCVGGEYDITVSDEDRSRSRRLSAEDWRWLDTSRVLSGRTIGRSGDTVCSPHRTHGGDEKHGFLSLASKLMVTGCQWFGLKTTVMIS